MLRLIILVLLVLSCNKKSKLKFQDNRPQVNQPQVNRPVLESISYADVKTKVFDVSCVRCHGNDGGVTLETYEEVFHEMELIRITTLEEHSMPKGSSLSAEQIEVLTAWINAGGPNESVNIREPSTPTEPPVVVTPPTEPPVVITPPTEPVVIFDTIKSDIIENKCMGCHARPNLLEKFPLNSRDGMLQKGLLVPGNAEVSLLYKTLLPTARKVMPPNRPNVKQLTQEEINAIKTWIDNGAL
jgi:uncharacterized membrane protein